LDLSKALYRNRAYLLGGCAVIVLVVCVVTLLSTRLVTRPVKALIHQAKQATEGEKGAASVPLQSPGTYEVDSLSKAVAQMSATLEKRADYIRAFASNVSHEFKTPLTSIRGTVELLKDHLAEMPAEDRERFLHILEQDTDRLTRLVQRLLDLARADVLTPGVEQTDVAVVLHHVAERFRREGLNVSLEISPGIRSIALAPEVFESVVSNLLDNAKQHGGSRVNVQLSARATKDAGREHVEICVQDDGKGITEHDTNRVFAPFFTTARQSGGTGLGLSIVQTLVTAHQGSITLEPCSHGARFRLVLPVAHRSRI
jgi:signal transduction histidine kinase